MNVKRIMKKMMAVLLAITMCVPTNLVEAVSAATEEDGVYTVTIGETEHGTISFADSEKKTKDFEAGEEVNFTMTADDGYQIRSFTVTSTDTGAVVAEEETTDDTYSFTMPEKNLTVTGSFEKEDSAEITTETSEEDAAEETAEETTEEIDYEIPDDLDQLKDGTMVYADLTEDEKTQLFVNLFTYEKNQAAFLELTDDEIQGLFGMTREEQQAEAKRLVLDNADYGVSLFVDTVNDVSFDSELFFGISKDDFLDMVGEAIEDGIKNADTSSSSSLGTTLKRAVRRAASAASGSTITSGPMWSQIYAVLNRSENKGKSYGGNGYSSDNEWSCAGYVSHILDQVEDEYLGGSKISTISNSASCHYLLDYLINDSRYQYVGMWTATGNQVKQEDIVPSSLEVRKAAAAAYLTCTDDSLETLRSTAQTLSSNGTLQAGDIIIYLGGTSNLTDPTPHAAILGGSFISGYQNEYDATSYKRNTPSPGSSNMGWFLSMKADARNKEKASQGFIVFRISTETKPSYVNIKKASSLGTTNFEGDDNDQYLFEGAEFEIYYDSACKQKATDKDGNAIGKLVTDENGKTETVKIKAPSYPVTYYVKETKAPKGYELNKSVVSVTYTAEEAKAKTTKTVTFKDNPVFGEFPITVLKQNAKKDTAIADTIFEVAYYLGDNKKDDIKDGKVERERKWYFKTDKNGKIDLSTVTSDDLVKWGKKKSSKLYTSGGKVVWPCGTYTIKEVEAAPGYTTEGGTLTIGDTTVDADDNFLKFSIKSKSDGKGGYTAEFYKGGDTTALNKNTTLSAINPDAHTELKIVKETQATSGVDTSYADDNTQYKLSGAKFTIEKQVTSKDSKGNTVTSWETVKTVKTNTAGIAKGPSDLTAGTYRITEIQAPKGHTISSPASQTVTLADNEDKTVTFSDPPISASSAITLKKTGYDNKDCVGAVFKLCYYLSSPSKEDMKTETPERTWYIKTDNEGKINMDKDTKTTSFNGASSDALYKDASGNTIWPCGACISVIL